MKTQTFHAGDIVYFGMIEENEIEWKIVTIDEEGALLTSCYGLALHAYDDSTSPTTWKDCSLRKWLNTDFYGSAFSPKEQEKIHSVFLAEENTEISFSDAEDTADKVFILSEAETERYFANPSDRMLLYNERVSGTWAFGKGYMTTCRWWMRGRTEAFNGRNCAPVCDHDGSFGGYQTANSPRMAVRPALWVDTKALRPADLPDIGQMSIRLKTKASDTLTFFDYGFEDQRAVLARFVDYETQEEYVMLRSPYGLIEPLVARVSLDYNVGESIEKKARILGNLLSRNTYENATDQLLKKMDENRVRVWMHQVAWSPSPRECQNDIQEGDVIQFGKMAPGKGKKKQPISWIVLRRIGSKALLITEKGIKSSNFMDDDSEEWEWEHSWIRSWLNTEFYKRSFTAEERRKIQNCMTESGDVLGRVNEKQMVFDHVFLLSDAEANVFFSSDAARIIRGTPNDVPFLLCECKSNEDEGDWWWLRSPGDVHEYVCCVSPDGHIDRRGCWVHSTVCAIRPSILIDLTDDEFLG